MEQELIVNEQNPDDKIYKDKAIYVGTLLGGPLVAGYLIANNFKVFHEPNKAKKAWIYTIIVTVVIFGSFFLVPNIDKIPNELIPLIYAGITYYLVKSFQGEKIDSFIDSGGQTYSWWRTILISTVGLIITIIPIFFIVLSMKASFPTDGDYMDLNTYGIIKNEIHYNGKNISNNELDKIADGLTKTAFFDQVRKRAVYVKKVGKDYEISIGVDNVKNKEKLYLAFAEFRNKLQAFFPNNKIIINVVEDNINNVIERIE